MNPPSSSAAASTQGQWLVLTAAFLGWMFDGLEMGIFPLVARPALQEMQAAIGVLDEQFVQTWMGRITALFLLGAASGGLVFGWLGDRLGRVRAMTLSILAYSLSRAWLTLPDNPGIWALCGSSRRWAWAVNGLSAWPWSWNAGRPN